MYFYTMQVSSEGCDRSAFRLILLNLCRATGIVYLRVHLPAWPIFNFISYSGPLFVGYNDPESTALRAGLVSSKHRVSRVPTNHTVKSYGRNKGDAPHVYRCSNADEWPLLGSPTLPRAKPQLADWSWQTVYFIWTVLLCSVYEISMNH